MRCRLGHSRPTNAAPAATAAASVLRAIDCSRRHHASCASGSYTILKPPPGHVFAGDARPVVDVRLWTRGVEMEDHATAQVLKMAALPILRHPIAVMPDIHAGVGAAPVGVVVPTYRAVIPDAVGVDIGCGMIALKTSMVRRDLAVDMASLRIAIEEAIPHGRTHNGDPNNDAGGWCQDIPPNVAAVWNAQLAQGFRQLCVKRPMIEQANHINHLGTLGTGNHFVEVCVEVGGAPPTAATEPQAASGVDEGDQPVWFMIHSGSRGVGGRIGATFIAKAKDDMGKLVSNLPNKDLAYFNEGTSGFDEYVFAVHWAQEYARLNRELMMENMLRAVRTVVKQPFTATSMAVNCHHNYVEKYYIPKQQQGMGDKEPEGPEQDYVWLTRKGATSARRGELAVIPGSMGARSYIVRGKGNADSYNSCSHGAGRRYSRGEATRRFTVAEHELATEGVECRKDAGVLDETPMAYKSIDAVMHAQADLVDVVCTLKQVLCVKG